MQIFRRVAPKKQSRCPVSFAGQRLFCGDAAKVHGQYRTKSVWRL
ncbi:hypothetical protein RUMCAL_00653, partial [Ruminococcus callidus ATCC 27760]